MGTVARPRLVCGSHTRERDTTTNTNISDVEARFNAEYLALQDEINERYNQVTTIRKLQLVDWEPKTANRLEADCIKDALSLLHEQVSRDLGKATRVLDTYKRIAGHR